MTTVAIYEVTRQFTCTVWLCDDCAARRRAGDWTTKRGAAVDGACDDCHNERERPAVEAWQARWRERIPARVAPMMLE